jgi:type IV pilus assembly protein PilX
MRNLVLMNKRRTGVVSRRRNQQGAVLMAVLLVLGMLLLAGVGVLRSVDTGNVIAGNYSFQQQAVLASDRAINVAMNSLSTRVASNGGNTAEANAYLNLRATALDDRGFPSTIDWSAVACVDEVGAAIASCSDTTGGKYRVQYVIERLCTEQPTLNDVQSLRANCEYEANASALKGAVGISLRYRIVVRVRGPRNTDGWFEAVVSAPANA